MTPIRALLAGFAVSCLFTATTAVAQTVGGAVPAYEAPAPAALPQRDGNVTVPVQRDASFPAAEQVGRDFSNAYNRAGRPRLAFYWNRQLSDTLTEWYGDSRVVITNQGGGNLSGSAKSPSFNGEVELNSSSSSQTTIEAQRRMPGTESRLQPSESWEWQFQDGFLAPFLKAGAIILDRAAIIRLTGATARGDSASVEAMALQGMADYLVEVLVTPQGQSNIGYELRARVLEIKTGRIVSYVNSRSTKAWNPPREAVATSQGLYLPDEDDESFGPVGNERYRATNQGFVQNRRPPKLATISENLAYNLMAGLTQQWR